MKKSLIVRSVIDLAMLALYVTALAERVIGSLPHEIIGVTLVLLFVLHNALNYRFYRKLFRGKYGAARIAGTLINLLLIVFMTLLAVSSAMISTELLPALNFGDYLTGRSLHIFAAYWGLLLMGLHLGLHWRMVLGLFRKLINRRASGFATWLIRAAGAATAAYGIYGLTAQDVFAKITMRFGFGFYETSAVSFYAEHIAVVCLFAWLGYYAVVAAGAINKKIHKTNKEIRRTDMENQTIDDLFPRGEVNPFGKYFIGTSWLKMLTDTGVIVANVTFAPGCRNNWHIHRGEGGGQILLCTGGRGWYCEEGKEPRELRAGDVVNIPADVKHWHGAAKDSEFSHIAIEVPCKNGSTEWCEPVTDAVYNLLP